MADPNKIIIVSEYQDNASPAIEAAFAKQIASLRGYSNEFNKFQKSVNQSTTEVKKVAKENVGGVSDALKTHQEQTRRSTGENDRFRVSTSGLRREIGALRNQFLLFFFVYRPLKAFFIDITNAAIAQEDAIKRLNNALDVQGTYSDYTSKKLQALSDSFQKASRYGNDDLLVTMQQLIAIGGVLPSQMERMTRIVINFAAANPSRTLAEATTIVAKVAAGYTGQLGKLGIKIDESIPKYQRAAAALTLLEEKFKGSAQKDIDTYSGKIEQLKNTWSDFYKELGKVITRNALIKKFMDEAGKVADRTTIFLKAKNEPKNLDAQLDAIKENIKVWKELSGFDQERYVKEGPEARLNDRSYDEYVVLLRKEVELTNMIKERNKLGDIAAAKAADDVKKQAIIDEKVGQHGAAWTKFQADYAQQAMKSWEDIFFDGMTNKFKGLTDIVIEFGNTVLRMLIRLGIEKAIIGAGLGGWFNLPGTSPKVGEHMGGYIRHGLVSSSGYAPKRYHSGGEVPALLLPGEGVLNRNAMNNLGVSNLNRLNRGESAGGGETINNYYIQTIDERSFRDRLQQHGDVYSSAVSNDLPGNKNVRRSIQRYGR